MIIAPAKLSSALALGLLLVANPSGQAPSTTTNESYLTWSSGRAEAVGKAMNARGRVGGFWDTRLLKTERSYNYKLRATWLIPEVIRASARLEQLRRRLNVDQTRSLVAEAEAIGDTVIMVEIDPREGSGIVPLDWMAFLHGKRTSEKDDDSDEYVRGENKRELERLTALAGVERRNYDYRRFWVVFPLVSDDDVPLFTESTNEAELVVHIYDKEGRVSWPIPGSIRERMRNILTRQRERAK